MRTSATARSQPRDGDVVLFCSHSKAARSLHFWNMPHGVPWSNERTQTRGLAHWFVCCGDCYVACGGDPTRIDKAVLAIWKGDSPIVWSVD